MATSRASEARAAVDLTFEELYRGHRADVYRAALRELGNAHDAEDVTQAAFVDAYRAVLSGTRPQSPRAWLLAISENVRRRRGRTAQRRPHEVPVEDADFPLTADLPHAQSRALAEALAALPPDQRRVFVLREIVGLSYGEIADEVESTVGSIQMLLFRARRSLRAQLDPPTVSRRPVFLPPLPGWLAGVWSRLEVATLTPRAAGALGATVLTVAGASVAVPVPPAAADAVSTALVPSVAPVAELPAAHAVAKRAAPARTKLAARRRVSLTTTRPAQRMRPVAALPTTPAQTPTTVPDSAPAPSPTVATSAAIPPPTPGVVLAEPTRTAVTLVDDVIAAPASLPLPSVALPLPPVSLPVPLPLPLPSVPDVVETATGAAGAAGASAPPVPVPAIPLPTLPPTP